MLCGPTNDSLLHKVRGFHNKILGDPLNASCVVCAKHNKHKNLHKVTVNVSTYIQETTSQLNIETT